MLAHYYSYLKSSYPNFDMPILYEVHHCYSFAFFYVPFIFLKFSWFLLNLGNMKQKSNNFDILSFTTFPLHALEHGSGYKQSKCMKVVTRGWISMSMFGCLLDVHLWPFVSPFIPSPNETFFLTNLIWIPSIHLRFVIMNEAW